MSDIFISYSSEDRNRVLPLVNALEKTGWSVFWDRTIPAGKTWRQVIGGEIQTCRSVLVVWTLQSVDSEWVLEEAEIGKRKRILIPVLLDEVEPPFWFGTIQTANLVAWNGDNSSPSVSRLVADIAAILGPSPAAVKETQESRRLDAEAQEKAEKERLRERERQRSEEAAKRKGEDDNQRRAEENRNRAQQEAERRRPRTQPSTSQPALEQRKDRLEPGTIFRDTLKDGSHGPEMVVIPDGTFTMGAIGDNWWDFFSWTSRPIHQVKILKPFAMGRYEVTFEEYGQFVAATGRKLPDDKGWGRSRLPVINVSWNDALAYVDWLSHQTAKRYRLPSEAQWEYAARAGTETVYWWGNETKPGMANCVGGGSRWSGNRTSPVGSFPPNFFGLYDTAGNVWEWVQDRGYINYSDAPTDGSAGEKVGSVIGFLLSGWGLTVLLMRVIRGGSWKDKPAALRSSFRFWNFSVRRDSCLGFRLARDLE